MSDSDQPPESPVDRPTNTDQTDAASDRLEAVVAENRALRTKLDELEETVDGLARADARRGLESDGGRTAAPSPRSSASQTAPIDRRLKADGGQTYKILGELNDAGGIGVLGRNSAGTGTSYGIWGEVDSADGYGLYTPDDARIDGALVTPTLGTLTDEVFELLVGDLRALRIEPTTTDDASNIVFGHASNGVGSFVNGATISGGGYDDGSSDFANVVTDDYGTVGGGRDNAADQFGTVGGGGYNEASDRFATVAGGASSTAANAYTAVGGGTSNEATGYNATVAGGGSNEASGYRSAIGGGASHRATESYTTVAGGYNNAAVASNSTVGGGGHNIATANRGTVAGGGSNRADGEYSSVGGGRSNAAGGKYATIAGGGPSDENDISGTKNLVHDEYGTIGGGGGNVAGNSDGGTSAVFATVGGGENNTADQKYAAVGGGMNNEASNDWATVGGGGNNDASGEISTIGGGAHNHTDGLYATVPGGYENEATGWYSFAAGNRAKSNHTGSFVWGDSTGADVASTGTDQFLVRAGGGVGIGTSSPAVQLHVEDAVSGAASLSNHVAIIENAATNGGDVLALKTGETTADAGTNFVTFKDGDGDVGAIEGDGGGGITLKSGNADFAEYFPKVDPDAEFEPGTVVGLHEGQLTRDVEEAHAAFVVSESAIVLGNHHDDEDAHASVALVGQVPVRVRGPVESGDLLVASGDGTARSTQPESLDGTELVVGRALESFDSDAGTVRVFVDRSAETRDASHGQVDETERLREEIAEKDARIRDLEARFTALEERVTATRYVPADD